nr:MAG TPA: hypothetical protein [Caudoviricetes sp.]
MIKILNCNQSLQYILYYNRYWYIYRFCSKIWY